MTPRKSNGAKRNGTDSGTRAILRHWREAVPNDRLAHLVKDATRGLLRALQTARGQIRIGSRNSLLHFIDADVMRRQLVRIHLHANRILLFAEDLDARHASYHGDTLRQQVIGVIGDLIEGQRGRIDRQEVDRLLGRINLLIGGRPRHAGRQTSSGRGDCGLNILRRRVDIAAKVELHRDGGAALRIARAHRLNSGDG